MVCVGEIGKVWLVVINFSYGYYGDVIDVDNLCVCWCYDFKMVGVFGQFVDCGIYVLYMVSFVCDDEVEMLLVDFVLIIFSCELEDDVMLNFCMMGGMVGCLWILLVVIGC